MQQSPNLWRLLTTSVALVLGLLGVFFVLAPNLASSLFGIYVPELAELAYVRALGIRDVALCLFILALLPISGKATRRVLAASALIPAGDIVLVLNESGLSAPLPLLLHATSGAILLALSTLGRRDEPVSRSGSTT
jgi:hypothetical protein